MIFTSRMSASTLNPRLSPIRKLEHEMSDNQMLDPFGKLAPHDLRQALPKGSAVNWNNPATASRGSY